MVRLRLTVFFAMTLVAANLYVVLSSPASGESVDQPNHKSPEQRAICDQKLAAPALGSFRVGPKQSYYMGFYAGTPCPEPYRSTYRGLLMSCSNSGDGGLQHGAVIGPAWRTLHNSMTTLRLKEPLSTDLAITWVSGPSQSKAGSYVLISYKIANYGYNGAKDVRVGFYLSNDKFVDASRDRLMATDKFPAVPARSVRLRQTATRIPPTVSPGMYYLGVVADVHNDIVEVNKKNNRMSSKTQIMIFPNESTPSVTCTTQWTSLTDPWLRFLLPRVQLLKKGFPDEAFWARC